jgi:MFS family permease
MIGCACALALGMGACVATLPRSPRWLAFRAAQAHQTTALLPAEGFASAARDALAFYRPDAAPDAIDAELSKLMADSRASVGETKASWSAPFEHPRSLVIGCGLVLFQQITGQPSVLYEATPIFQSAGFSNAAALSSTGVGFVKLIATLFTVWRVDRYGRVFLLKAGIGMMLASLLAVAVGFCYRECKLDVPLDQCPQDSLTLPGGWAAVVVGALMVYVSGYQVGFGPIVWLMISEVFPLKVRGPAMSLACLLNFGSNIVMTATLSSLMETLTPPGVFFLYTALTAAAFGFVAKVVPETKGKTLEEIEAMLN